MLCGRSSTYPESQRTSGTDARSQMVTAADGVCTHLRMFALVVPRDGDGDFERGGEVKSRGCERVDTMVCGVFFF